MTERELSAVGERLRAGEAVGMSERELPAVAERGGARMRAGSLADGQRLRDGLAGRGDRMTERELSAVAELGYALMRAGNLGDARRLWEGLAGEAGHLAAPWRALAAIALREDRFDDCVAAANIAHQRQPRAPAPLVLRAEAMLRSGRRAEAQRDLQAALALSPRVPSDRLVLARARALTG